MRNHQLVCRPLFQPNEDLEMVYMNVVENPAWSPEDHESRIARYLAAVRREGRSVLQDTKRRLDNSPI